MNLPSQSGNTAGRSLYIPSYDYGLGPLPAPGTTNMLGQGINPPGDIPGPPPGGSAQPPLPAPPPGRPIPIFAPAGVPFPPTGSPDSSGAGSSGQQQPAAANVNVNIFGGPSTSYLGPAPVYGLYRIGQPSFWNPGPYNAQTADGRWLPGPYARVPIGVYGYGPGNGYIYYGPSRTQHLQNIVARADTSRDVEIAPADSDPKKWYNVIELDGNITHRTRYTIDSGDIGKVRWIIGQDNQWYAQRLRDN